ncbi:hypothetical protein K3495_g3499 [Podosphaera aphanis]|nr:hypothetical protein K3495_g3499 [Podosphaera aphanis]
MNDATLVLTRTSTAALTRSGLISRSSSVEGFPPNIESTRFKLKEEEIKSNALYFKSMIHVEGIRSQDQTQFEFEYLQNARPNSAEDCRVVAQVYVKDPLRENDEVQKSFQDSLQTNQRPSLLSSPVICAPASDESVSCAPVSMSSRRSSPCDCHEESEKCPTPDAIRHQRVLKVEERDGKLPCEEERVKSTASMKFSNDRISSVSMLNDEATAINSAELVSSPKIESIHEFVAQTPRCLSNRENSISNSILTPLPSHQSLSATPLAFATSDPFSHPGRLDPRVTKSASSIRLSLSLDGKEKLAPTSPSPLIDYIPRPRSMSGNIVSLKRKKNLRRRSIAALPSSYHIEQSLSNNQSFNRWPTGRSRDARIWRFCCDGKEKDRDELTLQAENESHGSAVAAINLIRSASKSKMKSNPKKRHIPVPQSTEQNEKRFKSGKTKSNQCGFRDPSSPSLTPTNTYRIDYTKNDPSESPSGDSDKENWLPQIHSSSLRRPLPSSPLDKSSHARKILGDYRLTSSNTCGLGSPKSRKRKFVNPASDLYEDSKIPGVADVENFIRSQVSPSKHKDLSAIQGLLSLSQGNWK